MNTIKQLINNKIIRYVFSGGMGAVTNIGILFLLTEVLNINYLISGIISFSCSVFISFIFQKKVTFNDQTYEGLKKKFIIFAIIAIINLTINTFFLYSFTEYLGLHYLASQIISGVIIAIWSFFLYKVIVFK